MDRLGFDERRVLHPLAQGAALVMGSGTSAPAAGNAKIARANASADRQRSRSLKSRGLL